MTESEERAISVAQLAECIHKSSARYLVKLFVHSWALYRGFGGADRIIEFFDETCDAIMKAAIDTHDEKLAVKLAKRMIKFRISYANDIAFGVLEPYLGTNREADRVLWEQLVHDKIRRLEFVLPQI